MGTCLYIHVLLVNSADCVLVYVYMYVHCLYMVLFTWWCTSVCTYTVGGTVYVVVYVSMYLQSKISFVLFESVPGLGYNTNSRKSSKSYFSCPFSTKKISH